MGFIKTNSTGVLLIQYANKDTPQSMVIALNNLKTARISMKY